MNTPGYNFRTFPFCMEFSLMNPIAGTLCIVPANCRLTLILSDGLGVIPIAGREEVSSVVGGDEIEVVCFCRIKGGINGFKSRVGDRTGG